MPPSLSDLFGLPGPEPLLEVAERLWLAHFTAFVPVDRARRRTARGIGPGHLIGGFLDRYREFLARHVSAHG
ncbi:MAG: hypothetical protein ACR2JR_01230 [Rubrobacteraceae bacterium]